MKSVKILFVVYLTFIISHCFCQNPSDKILGTFLTQDKSSKVEFYKSGDKYYGKVIWMKDPIDPKTKKPYLDSDNPDPAKKTMPVMGMVVINGVSYDKDCWDGGTIYDPNTGKTWDCSVSFNGSQLKVKGFWKFSWIGKTELWTKSQSQLSINNKD